MNCERFGYEFHHFRASRRKNEQRVLLVEKYAEYLPEEESRAVSFSVDARCHGDGYRIEVGATEICIFANTAVAFNAAVGYLIRNRHGALESRYLQQ